MSANCQKLKRVLVPLFAAPALFAAVTVKADSGVTVILSTTTRSVSIGETAEVTAFAVCEGMPARRVEIWTYLNGKRWGRAWPYQRARRG
jgi:hypothetical protein